MTKPPYWQETLPHASHFCKRCGAWWLLNYDGSWQLRSDYAGVCCNNAAMHGNSNIVSVRSAWEAVSKIISSASVSAAEAQPALSTQEQIMRLAEEWGDACMDWGAGVRAKQMLEARAALQAALSALPKEQP